MYLTCFSVEMLKHYTTKLRYMMQISIFINEAKVQNQNLEGGYPAI